LGKAVMMRLSGATAADEAGLAGNDGEMCLVADALFFRECQLTGSGIDLRDCAIPRLIVAFAFAPAPSEPIRSPQQDRCRRLLRLEARLQSCRCLLPRTRKPLRQSSTRARLARMPRRTLRRSRSVQCERRYDANQTRLLEAKLQYRLSRRRVRGPSSRLSALYHRGPIRTDCRRSLARV
jgi:hypothetical protein